jgi:mannose-6-phosphate isomerase-like protein (cupin superfamily)
MYDSTDPRSALATATAAPPAPKGGHAIAATQYVELPDTPPQEVSPAGSRTWYVRGQNFVLAHTDLVAGDSLTRTGQEHEYVVLLTEPGTHVRIDADGATHEVAERAVVVVPPGGSTITAVADTTVTRLFDHRSQDVLDQAVNGAAYSEPDARVAPLVPWPEPVGGHRVRVYPIDTIPVEPARFGRIFRTSAFMVNLLDLQQGPRDPEKLSPHHHDDFEQCSYAVEGRFVHHIRTPWGGRRSQWRDDEHREVGSPSVTIIPPPVVHTSEAVDAGRNQLIDIFCPPREDFSAQPGWVLNADEYPAP